MKPELILLKLHANKISMSYVNVVTLLLGSAASLDASESLLHDTTLNPRANLSKPWSLKVKGSH